VRGAVGKKGAAGAARGSDGMVVAGTPAPTKRAAEDVGANCRRTVNKHNNNKNLKIRKKEKDGTWGGRCCCCCCPVSPVEELAQPLVPPPPKSVAFFAGELPNVLLDCTKLARFATNRHLPTHLKDMLLPLVVQRCSFFSGLRLPLWPRCIFLRRLQF
jgi:hypothetical protein